MASGSNSYTSRPLNSNSTGGSTSNVSPYIKIPSTTAQNMDNWKIFIDANSANSIGTVWGTGTTSTYTMPEKSIEKIIIKCSSCGKKIKILHIETWSIVSPLAGCKCFCDFCSKVEQLKQ